MSAIPIFDEEATGYAGATTGIVPFPLVGDGFSVNVSTRVIADESPALNRLCFSPGSASVLTYIDSLNSVNVSLGSAEAAVSKWKEFVGNTIVYSGTAGVLPGLMSGLGVLSDRPAYVSNQLCSTLPLRAASAAHGVTNFGFIPIHTASAPASSALLAQTAVKIASSTKSLPSPSIYTIEDEGLVLDYQWEEARLTCVIRLGYAHLMSFDGEHFVDEVYERETFDTEVVARRLLAMASWHDEGSLAP